MSKPITIDGQEFELVDLQGVATDSYGSTYVKGAAYALKPIQPPEPEWEVTTNYTLDKITVSIFGGGVKANELEVLKDAVEALMEYVYAEGGSEYPLTNQNAPMLAIKKARTLLKGKE